jgi:hypothetical protein
MILCRTTYFWLLLLAMHDLRPGQCFRDGTCSGVHPATDMSVYILTLAKTVLREAKKTHRMTEPCMYVLPTKH